MLVLFAKLLVAHLLGDFILFRKNPLTENTKRLWRSRWLLLHSATHLVCAWIALWDLSLWPYALAIAFSHYLGDLAGSALSHRPQLWFTMDQLFHVLIMAVVAALITGTQLNDLIDSLKISWVVVAGLVAVTLPAARLISVFLAQWPPAKASEKLKGMASAGLWIGILERVLIYIFIVTGHWEGIGFLLAAKSIFQLRGPYQQQRHLPHRIHHGGNTVEFLFGRSRRNISNLFQRMTRLVPILIATMLLTSCAQSVTRFYPEIIPNKMNVTLPVAKDGRHSVNLTYLGCGNMIIEQNGDAIVTDPFFSIQKFLKTLGKVKTDPDQYERWKNKLQTQASRGTVRAGLVSHTHYDHVMDLPTLLQAHYFNKMEVVYGNSYLPQMMVNFQKEGVRLEGLSNEQIFQPTISNDQAYGWIHVTPKIRFLAIESNHAPHTKRKLYMSKPLRPDYFKEKLVWPGDKIKAMKWTVGTTYSFLVDFIDQDTLRMFIQTSASQYPYGKPPLEELKKKKVDVAVLCYASALNVKDYPKAIVRDLDPAKLIVVHWEDFFREQTSDDDVKMVRKTNPRKTRKRFDELGKKKDFFIMPKPGTKVQIAY